jgi:hypothetical protein
MEPLLLGVSLRKKFYSLLEKGSTALSLKSDIGIKKHGGRLVPTTKLQSNPSTNNCETKEDSV